MYFNSQLRSKFSNSRLINPRVRLALGLITSGTGIEKEGKFYLFDEMNEKNRSNRDRRIGLRLFLGCPIIIRTLLDFAGLDIFCK